MNTRTIVRYSAQWHINIAEPVVVLLSSFQQCSNHVTVKIQGQKGNSINNALITNLMTV